MALAKRRIDSTGGSYWPGFVDALATLLLVLIFLLSIFMIAQFLLAREISGQETTLTRLESQVAELSRLLDLEQSDKATLEVRLAALTDSLGDLSEDKAALEDKLSGIESEASSGQTRIGALEQTLETEKELKAQALSRVELLNQQLAALRRQLASLESALDASERRDEQSKTRIKELGARLNAALARRVKRLESYRSDFFGRLREILGNRSDIQVVGDRFIFQAEVLFAKGDATLNAEGQQEMDKLASALNELRGEIPDDINWILRVDGHTDADPIETPQFPSNWELSTARAITVVRYLVDHDVPPQRLAATGFGEHQPLDPGEGEEAFRRNRRIELKLTER